MMSRDSCHIGVAGSFLHVVWDEVEVEQRHDIGVEVEAGSCHVGAELG